MRDIDIRRVLRDDIDRRHPDKTDTRVIDELGICQGLARVDLAVVNGTIHGYEIKSERDTLARLQGQAKVYSQALDYVTIVVAASHLSAVKALVPEWWGIEVVHKQAAGFVLETERQEQRNPSIEREALVQFLWRDEALEILIARDLSRGVAAKSRKHIWKRLSDSLSADELGELVRLKLKQRGPSWRSDSLQV